MTKNSIGCSVYISAALPATNDAAGFEALSWTEIGGLVEGPQFGYSHEVIDIPDLKSGYLSGAKGAAAGTDTQMQFREVESDTGQALAKTTADDNDGLCSIKVGYGTGTNSTLTTGDPVEYAQGFLHSHLPNKPTITSFRGFTVGFRSNEPSIIDTEPA